ncbi:DUF1015 domain-containing protein [Taibaiella sp. KBW10]|uniref:DUF1015 domain-containing protein n=1 Tax=Taibaiella sp. KBW10 TaxID=2153357 RepID=UPI000F59FB89|nr:DUF1015 family protein [Taibaiella sp. KBW10]RQO31182.1 DUF1015 domain-containing protein [Taibaiella sp. KBW10]
MAKIAPFKGLRPRTDIAAQVAALPYDVSSADELNATKNNPYNFNHITRSEIDLPETTGMNSPEVYDKAQENLEQFIAGGIMTQDEQACYYIYRLIMDGRSQTGLVCCSSLEDYENELIKKHEFTRPDRVLDRANHIKSTNAHTGLVFLACKDVTDLNELLEQWKKDHEATNDFVSEDGIQHTFWVVNDAHTIETITHIFKEQIPYTYIADGHHRTASALQVAHEFDQQASMEDKKQGYRYYLTCVFPESQVAIMDYNRVVKDLNGLSEAAFMEALMLDFELSEAPAGGPYRPQQAHEFGMYLNQKWYILKVKPDTYTKDPVSVLDVSILQNNILSKILNIHDPRVDTRVEFVGGIRGLQYLQRKVDSGEMAAAFSCYPVSVSQLFEVADGGKVMPPKSTWFEPKTRDGLVVHMI